MLIILGEARAAVVAEYLLATCINYTIHATKRVGIFGGAVGRSSPRGARPLLPPRQRPFWRGAHQSTKINPITRACIRSKKGVSLPYPLAMRSVTSRHRWLVSDRAKP